jgi:DNA replication and repair protein RecF
MKIQCLELVNFRNHATTILDFREGINLITGPNGVGKTNIIDAIHYICMSKSFVASTDSYVVKQGESTFSIKASIDGEIRKNFELSCVWTRGEGKYFEVNGSRLDRLSDLIGIIPVVVLSPDDRKITNEGPAERRSFLDSMISQVSKSYLLSLMEYRKIVRQRNSVLSSGIRNKNELVHLLEPWDVQLVKTGSSIILKRIEVLKLFAGYLEKGYKKISGINLTPGFTYKTITDKLDEPDKIAGIYRELLAENRERETEREMTLIGPHRDELVFYLDDMELRKYGSQGQHRLFALSLKLAELHYFNDVLDDLPVFLLDDVFGDLDPSKIQVLTEMLESHPGQSFVTAANEAPFSGLISFKQNRNKRFSVSSGPVVD